MRVLLRKIRKFAKERDWNKYHSPKNLVMGLGIEVSELQEVFLWLTDEESKELNATQLAKVKEEIGDVMIYLVNLADKFGIDPIECAKEKIKINDKKYPVNKVKGSSKKYTEYK